jgi:hypothetical protein
MGYSDRDSIPILRIRISDNVNVDENEPAVLFTAGVHADEVLGPEVILSFTADILNRYDIGDTMIQRLVNSLEIFEVPFINPEGRLVVENGDLDWRKNKSDNDSNGVFTVYDGVDNNRNYDMFWTNGTYTNPSNPEYRGPFPFSESENRAMAAFVNFYKPVVALDYHSPATGRGNIVYVPWSSGTWAPDWLLLNTIGSDYASRIRTYGNAVYAHEWGSVKGDLRTYLYGQLGTINYTVEISDTTILNPAQVDSTVGRVLPGMYFMMQRALGNAITGVIRDSITGEPLEAEITVSGYTSNEIRPRLSRPDNGKYYRLLGAGTYTLLISKPDYYRKTIRNVVVLGNHPTTVDVLLSPLHPRPPAPNLVYPAPRDSFETGIFTFDWSDPVSYNAFRLEVARDTSFGDYVIFDSMVTFSQYRPSAPLALGHYYWRVKAHNLNGWGPYSTVRDFHIVAWNDLANRIELPEDFCLYQNYPNPFNSATIIAFDLPRQSQVELSCYDITGSQVVQLESGVLGAGYHEIKWDGLNSQGRPVASGVYFSRFIADDYSAIAKMILIK